jgi:hypothetical protein
MKTTMMTVLVGASLLLVACGDNGNNNNPNPDMAMQMMQGGGDMAMMQGSTFDMEQPTCISATPVSYTDFLNACTNAQSGDPAKDYPYFPTLAPAGVLPPLQ